MPDLSKRPPDAPEGKFTGQVLRQTLFGTAPPAGVRTDVSPARRYPFERHLDAARQRPKVTAKIAVYTQGGRKETTRKVNKDAAKIRAWIKSSFWLEKWVVMTRTTPNTWYHKELWVRFDGYMTPAEAERYWAERSAIAGHPQLIDRNKNRMDRAASAQVVAMRSAERRYG